MPETPKPMRRTPGAPRRGDEAPPPADPATPADPGTLTAGRPGAAAPPAREAIDTDEMTARAREASSFLKALAHEGRLMILCHLSQGEKSVTELETLLASRQAAVSQQLARLRLEGLVQARREGKAIYYSLADPRAQKVVGVVYEIFCRR